MIKSRAKPNFIFKYCTLESGLKSLISNTMLFSNLKKDSEFTETDKSELNKVTDFIKDVIKQSSKALIVKGIENISLHF